VWCYAVGEFTGLDLEMAIGEHYNEVLQVTHNVFKHIFNGLETRWRIRQRHGWVQA
jgi:aspartyl/asparaginyl-tRNA synthetase